MPVPTIKKTANIKIDISRNFTAREYTQSYSHMMVWCHWWCDLPVIPHRHLIAGQPQCMPRPLHPHGWVQSSVTMDTSQQPSQYLQSKPISKMYKKKYLDTNLFFLKPFPQPFAALHQIIHFRVSLPPTLPPPTLTTSHTYNQKNSQGRGATNHDITNEPTHYLFQ